MSGLAVLFGVVLICWGAGSGHSWAIGVGAIVVCVTILFAAAGIDEREG